MDMRGIFVTPRQVESADQASFELVHIGPGWVSLGNLLVSTRYSYQPSLGRFSFCIQYQERARAWKCDVPGLHRW